MHEENCNFFDHAGFKMTLFPYENGTVQSHRPNFLNPTFSQWFDIFSQSGFLIFLHFYFHEMFMKHLLWFYMKN